MGYISPGPTFWGRYGRILLGIALVLLAAHDIFGAHGFLAMRRSQKEIEQIRANIDRLDKENTALDEQIKELKTDPHAIERIAREEMGLARPGEVIIKLPPPEPQKGDNGGH
jgi:cell division protein FtsB